MYIEKPRFFGDMAVEGEERKKDLTRAHDFVERAKRDMDSRPNFNKNDELLLVYVKERLLLEEGNIEKAIQGFEALYNEAYSLKRLKFEFLARVGLGLCFKQRKDWPAAEKAFKEAVDIAEDIRETLDPTEQTHFLDGEEVLGIKHGLPAKELAWIRGIMGREEQQPAARKALWGKALDAAEKTKGRAFVDTLTKARLTSSVVGMTALIDRHDDIADKVKNTSNQLKKLSESEAAPYVKKRLEKENDGLKNQLQAIRKEMKKLDPEYFNVRFGGTVPLAEARLGADEWALVYDVTDSGVLGFLVHGKEIAHATCVDFPRSRLDGLVRKIRKGLIDDVWEGIKSGSVTSERQVSKELPWDYQALSGAKELFEAIVAELEARVPKDRSLIAVTDGSLAMLPFEMLVTNIREPFPRDRAPRQGDVKFLVDSRPIVYYQSLNALTSARSRWAQSPKPGDKVLVMADPRIECKGTKELEDERKERIRREMMTNMGLSSGSGRGRRSKGMRAMSGGIEFLSPEACSMQRHRELPKTALLAKKLGQLIEKRSVNIYDGDDTNPNARELPRTYEGDHVQVYCGREASLVRFNREIRPRLEQFGRLVFATHGVFYDQAESDGPALMLSTNPPGAFNWLRSSEIAECKMNADLVALVACTSGLGDLVLGEGIMSMGRTFQLAGSRSVLMSLWETDEKASTELAQAFFQKLVKEQKPKLEAFRAAQNQIRTKDNGDFAHPVFWAPFILVGEAGTKAP